MKTYISNRISGSKLGNIIQITRIINFLCVNEVQPKCIVLNTIIVHSLSNNSNKGLYRKAWHIIYAKAAESGGRMTRKGRITGKGCVEGTLWERVAAYRTVRPAVGAFPRGFHGDDAGKLVDPRCNNRDVESSCLTVVRPGILFIRCQVLQEGPSFVRGIVKSRRTYAKGLNYLSYVNTLGYVRF